MVAGVDAAPVDLAGWTGVLPRVRRTGLVVVDDMAAARKTIAAQAGEITYLRQRLAIHEAGRGDQIGVAGKDWAAQRQFLVLLAADIAAQAFITVDELCGPSKAAELVAGRRRFAWQARAAGFTLRRIGAALGGRDHSTVSSLLRRAAGDR